MLWTNYSSTLFAPAICPWKRQKETHGYESMLTQYTESRVTYRIPERMMDSAYECFLQTLDKETNNNDSSRQ